MTALDWITGILLGGLLGILGQGIRIIVGLKKLNDEASAESVSFGSKFQTGRLGLSLLMFFPAGALPMTAFSPPPASPNPPTDLITPVVGAATAATDFIEGFIHKYLPLRSVGA